MGETILKTNLRRELGYLYYVGTGSDGCLVICKAQMQRGGRKKKEKK